MKKTSIITSALVLLSTILSADITIKNGWQLLGATQDVNTSIFDSTCVDYIWKYDATDINNAQWQVHIANAVAYNNTMAPITSLVKGEGYWVKGNGDCTITLAAPAPIIVASSPLKQTGQVVSAASFDDGDYKTGVTPSYTRVSNTVTDNVTKLMWQDDVTPAAMAWSAAQTYCSSLTLDSYTDWRVPTINELVGLVDYGKSAPSINQTFLNTVYDANSYLLYWSSRADISPSGFAWVVTFKNGEQKNSIKTASNYVRCVR